LRSNDESKEGLQEFTWAGFDITPQKLTCLEMVAHGSPYTYKFLSIRSVLAVIAGRMPALDGQGKVQ
jgi:hypothetical protein